MKKIILSFCIIAFTTIITTSCEPFDDSPKLPSAAHLFIENYLQGFTILQIEEANKESDSLDKYVVTFSDNLTIAFDFMGFWRTIDSNKELPNKLLETIDIEQLEALRAAYPDLKVTGIYNTKSDLRVKLKDNTLLAIYNGFDKATIDEDITAIEERHPQEVKNFINNYFADFNELSITHNTLSENETYRMEIQLDSDPLIKANFDKEGKCYYFLSFKRPIPDGLYKSLPEEIRNYHQTSHPESIVYGFTRHESYYQLYLGGTLYILIDPKTGVCIPPDENVMAFINQHFSKNPTYTINNYLHNDPDMISYYYRVDIDNNIINMLTNTNGNYIQLWVRNSIPQSVLDTLPSSILTYISEHKFNNFVYLIKHHSDGYSIGINNSHPRILRFDKNGNFVR